MWWIMSLCGVVNFVEIFLKKVPKILKIFNFLSIHFFFSPLLVLFLRFLCRLLRFLGLPFWILIWCRIGPTTFSFPSGSSATSSSTGPWTEEFVVCLLAGFVGIDAILTLGHEEMSESIVLEKYFIYINLFLSPFYLFHCFISPFDLFGKTVAALANSGHIGRRLNLVIISLLPESML